MKTALSLDHLTNFLRSKKVLAGGSLRQLEGGHIAQAFSFVTPKNQKLGIRIADNPEDFESDRYAYDNFSEQLPIPKVLEIGPINQHIFFCISEWKPGEKSNRLSDSQFKLALPSIERALADLFLLDVSGSHGYGRLDLATGNAKYPTWQACLERKSSEKSRLSLLTSAKQLKLDPSLVDQFIGQFISNLPFASEVRRLSHGDPGFDNNLVASHHLTAIIDWADVGYRDCMYDYAKLDFWWPGRYSEATKFGKRFGLETGNVDQRRALYFAYTALTTISWADDFQNQETADWLRRYVAGRVSKA